MWYHGRFCLFFQAEDGIRDLVRSRGLGDVYKRQVLQLVVILLTVLQLLQVLKQVLMFVIIYSLIQ